MLEDSSADLTVEATSLSVIDPGESDKDRRKVQETMAGKDVLDEERFPVIRFTSTRVKQVKKTHDGWEVTLEGVLSLHGVEKPISLPLHVSAKDGELRAEGEASLLQTDFGITPIKVGGGSVKVKNKVRIRFELVAEK
jgi:polyisoprenoid-binding protein YceI